MIKMKAPVLLLLLLVSLLVAGGQASSEASAENDILKEKESESMIEVKDGKEEQLNPNPNPKAPADENVLGGTIRGDDNPAEDASPLLQRQLSHHPGSKALWPNGVVPYVFGARAKSYTSLDKQKIHKGLNIWAEVSCVKFVHYPDVAAVRRAGLKYWLDVGVATGLCSAGGHVGSPQVTNLPKGCISNGTLAHEAGHVLGVMHTQNRDDRDYFLNYDPTKVAEELRHNFAKAGKTINPYPYDLQSIMHYGRSDILWAKDSRLNFMMGSRDRLTHYDVATMNYLYKCTAKCPYKRCENTGYVGVDCKCRCPDLVEGDRCERLSSTGISVHDPVCVDDNVKCKDKSFYWRYGRCFRYDCQKSCVECDQTVRINPICSKIINLANGQSQRISNPKNQYGKCLWLVKVNKGHGVRLTINKLSLPKSVLRSRGPKCPHWLEVRYSLVDQQGPKFCGSGWPHGTIESSPMGDYNYMVLRYEAIDRFVKPQLGFEATVTSIKYPDCPFHSVAGVMQVALEGLSTGKVLKQYCTHNYLYKSGDFKRYCQKDGTWDGERMNCIASQCTDLKDQQDICKGYGRSQCQSNPRTNEICPRLCCDQALLAGTLKNCHGLPRINSWYRNPFMLRRRNANFYCRRGYFATSGNLIRTCRPDGTWTGTNAVCSRVEAKDMVYLRLVFKLMDKNRNGVIDLDELRTMNRRMGGQGKEEIAKANMLTHDVNRSGTLSLQEVIPFIYKPSIRSMLNVDEMNRAFQEVDANKDGNIDRNEVRNFLRQTPLYYPVVESQISSMIKMLDRTGDGKIQNSELRKLLCKYTYWNYCGKEYYSRAVSDV